jgi:hypothetical protein
MARASGVLRVIVETELSLGEPNVDEGLVTWFDVRVTAGEGADSTVIGNARVARIHVGEASNLGEPLYRVLDADSGDLDRCMTCSSTRTGSGINLRRALEAICSS